MASAAQDEFNELMRDKERRTTHPEDDNDDARSFLNLSDDEDRTPPASSADPDDYAPRASTSSARHVIPRTRYGANTGPKGVISDAQNFRDSKRVHMTSQRSSMTSLQATAPQVVQDHSRTMWSRDHPLEKQLEESDEDDLDLDDGDTDFMHRWRQSRLKELQTGGTPVSKMHSRGRSRRLYGGLTTVDGEGYLEAVEGSGAETVVVVYIYDDIVRTLRLLGEIKASC